MIIRLLFSAVAVLSTLSYCNGQSPTTSYDVSPSQSRLQWTGYYLFNFGEHTGTVSIVDGRLAIDEHGRISGVVTADMKSIRDTDMAYEDGGKDLSEHLMSKDFFDATQYPRAKIEIIKSEPIADAKAGEPNINLVMNLTIKEVTQPVTVPAMVSRTPKGLTAIGKFKFDRTRWGVEYNSGKIFFEVGDGAISDAVALEFNIIAEAK